MVEGVQSWAELEVELERAAQKEKEIRLAAWLGLPIELCGVPINHMTLRHYTLLETAGNPFVVGGVPGAGAVAQFLWFLSKDFSLDEGEQKKFMRAVGALNYRDAVAEIRDYISDVFFDLPRADGDSSGPGDRTLTAALVHRFAKEYGWTAEGVLDSSLQQLFQLLRCQLRDGGAGAHSPLQDEMKREWLERVNAQAGAVN